MSEQPTGPDARATRPRWPGLIAPQPRTFHYLFACAAALVALAIGLAAWSAHTTHARAACRSGTTAGMRAELLLGRNAGQQLGVTRGQFRAFLDAEVTPRFPNGFTIIDANGQWREGPEAGIVREPSFALLVVLRDDADGARRLQEIADAYKHRFQQQSVLVSLSRTCFAL